MPQDSDPVGLIYYIMLNFLYETKVSGVNKLSKTHLKCLLETSIVLTQIRIGVKGDKKVFSTSFSPVTSTNVAISPKNFVTFSFDPFATLVKSCKAITSVSPKLLTLKQHPPFFWSNLYKIEVMITSLIEML